MKIKKRKKVVTVVFVIIVDDASFSLSSRDIVIEKLSEEIREDF